MNFFSITPFLLQTAIWPIMWVVLRVFGKITILGKEHIHWHIHGAIVAPNHASQFDPILIPATLNPFSNLMPMFYLARERAFYEVTGLVQYIYGGLFFKIWGAYPVHVGTRDYEYALKSHIEILDRGQSVCIFPEGGKTKDGKIGEGKSGVAYLAWRTGRPVLPVAIHGHHKMGPQDFFSRRRSIVVSYGKPITKEELFGSNTSTIPPTQEELKSATKIIMSRIREMYERI